MKQYKWVNPNLKRRYQKLSGFMWLCAAIALACLFILPEELKVWNLVPLIFAISMWAFSWRTHLHDVRLKRLYQNNKKS